MEHLLLKAATTATDQGTFTAVISTATVDRDKDIIEPAAVVASLQKWAALGKLVPLAYLHTDEVVGHIDPATATVKDNEVVVDGFVDQTTDRGAEMWRLVKSGTLSFSFGFLFDPTEGASKLANGGYRIKELDIFEVSAVPVGPANNDTRVLSWKGMTEQDATKELDALKARVAEVERQLDERKTEQPDKETKASRSDDPLKETALKSALGVLTEGAEPPKVVTKEKPKQVPELGPDELRKQSRDLILTVLIGAESHEPL